MAGLNLFDMLSQTNNGAGISQLAQQFGLDEAQAQSAVRSLLPALSSGLKRNVSEPGGLASLMNALQNGNHAELLDQPQRLAEPAATNDGNAILGHILGSPDVSRAAAARASETTGLSSDLLKQMLPVIASMAMGALSKQTQDQSVGNVLGGLLAGNSSGGSSGAGGGPLGNVLGSVLGGGGATPAGNDPLGGLGSLLDADGDGNAMDDIFDMLGRR